MTAGSRATREGARGRRAANALLNRRVGDRTQDPLAHALVDALDLLALEVRLALVDSLAHGRLGRRALLDDARLERKVEVGRVLVRRVDPPVADQEALEVGRNALGR